MTATVVDSRSSTTTLDGQEGFSGVFGVFCIEPRKHPKVPCPHILGIELALRRDEMFYIGAGHTCDTYRYSGTSWPLQVKHPLQL